MSAFERFSSDGYALVNVIDHNDTGRLIDCVVSALNDTIAKKYIAADPVINLEDYHIGAGADEASHRALMDPLARYIKVPERVNRKILRTLTETVFKPLWGHGAALISVILRNDTDSRRIEGAAMFRISRPNSQDSVDVHIDNNYGGIPQTGGNDVVADPRFVTLWMPLTGFDERYTLRLAPGSHRQPHPDDIYDGREDRVTMEISDDYASRFDYVRPDLKKGQGLVVHPNLLHGKSTNMGTITRTSIEFRIFDKTYIEAVYANF